MRKSASALTGDIAEPTSETSGAGSVQPIQAATAAFTATDSSVPTITSHLESAGQFTSPAGPVSPSESQQTATRTGAARQSPKTSQQKPEEDRKQQLLQAPAPKSAVADRTGLARLPVKSGPKQFATGKRSDPPYNMPSPFATMLMGPPSHLRVDSTHQSGVVTYDAVRSSTDGARKLQSPPSPKPNSETTAITSADATRQISSTTRPSLTGSETANPPNRLSWTTFFSTSAGTEAKSMPTVPEGRQLDTAREQDPPRLPSQVSGDPPTLDARKSLSSQVA
jgi:hypothetical protein